MENSSENIQKPESSNVEGNLLKIINLEVTVQKIRSLLSAACNQQHELK